MSPTARLAPAALLFLTACLGGPQSQTDAGADGASGSGADGGPAGPASTGTDCFTEPGVTSLCRGISSCPGLTVVDAMFPHCGFRPGGAAIELDCACDGQLCSMGTVGSCQEAADLLETTAEGTVCTVGAANGACR